MKPHPKIRKTVKWCGAVVTVLLVVVWVGSLRWRCEWSPDGWRFDMIITRGGIVLEKGYLELFEDDYDDDQSLPHVGSLLAGWSFSDAFGSCNWFDWGDYSRQMTWVRAMPLWPPPALSLSGTIVAWRMDTLARRRVRLNLCPKCSYDRTGLAVGAVCPECGAMSVRT